MTTDVDTHRRPRTGRTPRADERALSEVEHLVAQGYSPSRACEVAARGFFPFEPWACDRLRKKYRQRNVK